MACRAGWIPAGCTSSRMGRCLSHPAENIYELYYCVQILMIPAVDFIGQTANSDSVQLQCAIWSEFISSVPDGALQRTIMGNRNRLKPAWGRQHVHLIPHLHICANGERTMSVPITYSPRHSWPSHSKRFFKHESKGTNGDLHYVYEHVNVRTHVKTHHSHRDSDIRMFVEVARWGTSTKV